MREQQDDPNKRLMHEDGNYDERYCTFSSMNKNKTKKFDRDEIQSEESLLP